MEEAVEFRDTEIPDELWHELCERGLLAAGVPVPHRDHVTAGGTA
jgi:alkylation response protein AidB-like acyl-CoA dehydrogenase